MRYLILCILFSLTVGCYPHTGHAKRQSLEELGKETTQACARRDTMAWRLLTTRMLQEHPKQLPKDLRETIKARQNHDFPCSVSPSLETLITSQKPGV